MAEATTLQVREEAFDVWNDQLRLHVQVAGQGPPLVYFHPAAGMAWDPFLTTLAEQYTVYAPHFPGTHPDNPRAIHNVDSLWDVVLFYEETLQRLGVAGAPAIGQSFGGMLAAELAAHYPGLFSRLVLLDPIGLWREDVPVANWIAAAPEELPGLLFHDPNSEAAQAMLALPDDPDQAAAAQAALVWALGCTGKICWPIPDQGLRKRLHRITAPTLIVWGEQDRLAPVTYASEFDRHLLDSRVETVPECGHIPQVEQADTTLSLVRDFLTDHRG